MVKADNKFANFYSAVKRLNESNVLYKKNSDNDIYQDALIKRFEFTFELAWKTLRQFMIDSGYLVKSLSPKGTLAQGYQESILQNELVWVQMLEDRNLSAHDYGSEIAQIIADRISNKYVKELTKLSKYIAESF